MAKHMLSTDDNPFSPVTQFEEWNTWDRSAGYHTLDLLGRVAVTSDELSEADRAAAIEDAIDQIIELHAGGFYRKVPIPENV